MSWKKVIKKRMPDRLVYIYSVAKMLPGYLKARRDDITIPEIEFWTNKETVDLIINERKSLSRFGDGEIMWMSGEAMQSYQKYSPELAEDLREAFQSKNKNLLIGIPLGIFDSSRCNLYAKIWWRSIRNNFLSWLLMVIDEERIYCNTSITRPYMDYKDREYSRTTFDLLKRIWNEQDIVIVEGEHTKLGMGNDLLNNAKSIHRIICPAENAYEKIEEIKEAIRSNVAKDTMMLGALGPTASILAAQLCEEGYQFVDIGHIDIEYMWYLKRAVLRDTIEGKYVNESGVRTCARVYDEDEGYKASIICKVL